MPTVSLTEVSHGYGAQRVLEKANLTLRDGDRIALAGANGSGKSTLMKILARLLEPESGQVIWERDATVAYLPQSGIRLSGRSVREEADSAFDGYRALEHEMADLEAQLHSGGPDSERLVRRYHRLAEQRSSVSFLEPHAREEARERVLRGLGFARSDFDRSVSELSSGWQMRAALARTLLSRPDILLLDEPTNYLDLEAREWLEQYLAAFRGGLLIVAHDRFFLDRVVTRVAEVFLARLSIYTGNYSQYEVRREAELGYLVERYRQQQDEIAKMETFIRRFRYNASKARLVQSRIKALEKIEIIELPPSLKRAHITFPPAPHSGRDVLRVAEVARSYGDLRVLSGVSFQVQRGEKLAVVGINGAGKSTLLRLLARRLDADSGTITHGKDVAVGYYAQEEIESGETDPVIDVVERISPTEVVPRVRELLGAFLFRGDEVYKPAAVLSGGEASRLALLKLLLRPVNLLLLDEPTNHLDLATKDILLDALKTYQGTVVFVSHDRDFLSRLATRVVELEDHAAREFPGDYEYYRGRKEAEGGEADPLTGPTRRKPAEPVPEQRSRERDAARDDREESRRRRTEERRLRKEEAEVVERLEFLERERAGLEDTMTREEVWRDGERMKKLKAQLATNQEEQQKLAARWEELERLIVGMSAEG
jgi:ATP-binding cassette, subfamily F, member 3